MQKQSINGEIKRNDLQFYLSITLITLAIIFAYFVGVPTKYIAWVSFVLAAMSVTGNDAIQTIGTFIESKKNTPVIYKIVVFCGILYVVHLIAWVLHDREIHFFRLDAITYQPDYNLLQLLAPIILLIITRLKTPISTTFLILSLFSSGASSGVVEGILKKSFIGYGIAFSFALVLWAVNAKIFSKEYEPDYEPPPKSEKIWSVLQWISTSLLWISWLLQDTANIAVYIPRKLEFWEFFLAISIIAGALTYILIDNGGKIQEIVSEKSDLRGSKEATVIDFAYSAILFLFVYMSDMPMSTTWVFLGLLAGREIILHIITRRDEPYLDTLRKVGKDVIFAMFGAGVSLGFYYLSLVLYPQ